MGHPIAKWMWSANIRRARYRELSLLTKAFDHGPYLGEDIRVNLRPTLLMNQHDVQIVPVKSVGRTARLR